MKKTLLIFISILFSISIYAKDIRELIVTTDPPMSCQNCENKIKGNLRFEKGIKKIETNLKEQRVIVEYDADKTNPQQIENGFKKIGYNVEVIDSENPKTSAIEKKSNKECSGKCCKDKSK